MKSSVKYESCFLGPGSLASHSTVPIEAHVLEIEEKVQYKTRTHLNLFQIGWSRLYRRDALLSESLCLSRTVLTVPLYTAPSVPETIPCHICYSTNYDISVVSTVTDNSLSLLGFQNLSRSPDFSLLEDRWADWLVADRWVGRIRLLLGFIVDWSVN